MRVTIHNLHKTYGCQEVLKGITATFLENKIHCFSGINGAGKTTLFKIVAGMEKQDCGEVMLEDSCSDIKANRRLTYVNQRPYMFEGSVLLNLMYPLLFKGEKKRVAKEKAREMGRSLGIHNLLRKDAISLSGGEMKKVALGRALLLEPELLLLDEPFAHLDQHSSQTVEAIIKNYTSGPEVAAWIITHDESRVSSYADAMYTLRDGQLEVLKS